MQGDRAVWPLRGTNTSSTRLAAPARNTSLSTTFSLPLPHQSQDTPSGLGSSHFHLASHPLGLRDKLYKLSNHCSSYTTTTFPITSQASPVTMARYSRDQRRRSSPSTSPWMTMFYICALVFAPMLFMSMIPSAHAQEDVKDASSVTGPGKSRMLYHPARQTRELTQSHSHRYRSWNHLLLCWYHEGRQGRDSRQRPG